MNQEIDYLNKRNSEKLIASLSNVRHKVAFLIMLDCGLRVSECVSLQLSNFDFKLKTITIKSLKKRGKDKYRTIPISDRLYANLAQYIQGLKNLTPDTFLFANLDGTDHISRKALNRVCERFKKKYAGFSNLHPHALRHTFATQLLLNGSNLIEIKELLGHEKLETTAMYTHTPISVLRERIDTISKEKLPFFTSVEQFFFKPKAKTLINLSFNHNNFIIGRNVELEKTIDNLNKGINTLLLGGIGVGKTHILSHVTPAKKVLRFDDFSEIKKTLINALIFLKENDKADVFQLFFAEIDIKKLDFHLQKDSITNLCKMLIKLTIKFEYSLIIDNCDKITPRGIKALEELKDHFIILSTAREVPINKSSFLWNFDIIKINVLPRTPSLELIQKLTYDLEIEDYELFKNHLYEQSNGNPRVIFEMSERFRKEPIITSDLIRDIRHTGSMREYDFSIIVVIIFAIIGTTRYMAGELENESFKFIGGCALLLLVMSRYLFGYTKRKFI